MMMKNQMGWLYDNFDIMRYDDEGDSVNGIFFDSFWDWEIWGIWELGDWGFEIVMFPVRSGTTWSPCLVLCEVYF